MIRIHRGVEPAKLPDIRAAELARVGPIAALRSPTKDDLSDRYVAVRSELRERQFGKCAYCECHEQPKRNDLEHYRPKSIVPERHNGSERWVPRARGGSTRGLETISSLHLDDAENLLTMYQEHIRNLIEPARQHIAAAIATGHEAHIRETWRREVCRLLAPSMPLVALSRDALDHFFPLPVRKRWQLALDEWRLQLFARASQR